MWVICLRKAMYSNTQSKVQVNGSSSKPFKVPVGVHQGSVLSPLQFIIVMEALSREVRVSCPWELLYVDDLKNRLAAGRFHLNHMAYVQMPTKPKSWYSVENIPRSQQGIQSTLVVYVPLVLVLTQS